MPTRSPVSLHARITRLPKPGAFIQSATKSADYRKGLIRYASILKKVGEEPRSFLVKLRQRVEKLRVKRVEQQSYLARFNGTASFVDARTFGVPTVKVFDTQSDGRFASPPRKKEGHLVPQSVAKKWVTAQLTRLTWQERAISGFIQELEKKG